MSVSADKLANVIPDAQRRMLERENHNVDDKVLAIELGIFW